MIHSEATRGLIISDFNVENLGAYIRHTGENPQIQLVQAPFGQVVQTLLNGSLPCWDVKLDFSLVWTRPEAVIEPFRALLGGLDVQQRDLTEAVDNYVTAVLAASSRTKSLFVPLWTMSPYHQGTGVSGLKRGTGPARRLMEMNLRLLEGLEAAAASVFPLNASRWIELAGQGAYNPRLWYTAKIPFSNLVFKLAAADIRSALQAAEGRSRKLLILDLDNTLWGGVVGDSGWHTLTLGGHDPIGEAFVDFQHHLKALSRSGIVLGIVSKNEEAIALQAIDKHPEMILRTEDFAGWRINWEDKAQNIVDLVAELNLGLQSVVFIDDSPAERDRVRKALPEVLVPDWPCDQRFYPQALLGLTCFETTGLSTEDTQRSQMYVEERKRTSLRRQVASVDEWLHTLDITVFSEPLSDSNLARATQLLNKTNQMNLTTRRMTAPELATWCAGLTRRVWTFRVADKFGDSGLVGLASIEMDGERAFLRDFVLSCRVMGRKVEETMLHVVVDWVRQNNARQLLAVYVPTAKNKPCKELFEKLGWLQEEVNNFVWDPASGCPLHPAVKLMANAKVQTLTEIELP